MKVHRVLTSKADPASNRIDSTTLDLPLAPGQVLLAVRRAALTTNNITYALFGERMHYWQFFPSGQPDWGIVPVWGFADVADTRAEGLEVGERIYGYFPLADHLVVDVARLSRHAFVDAALHRAGLPAIYNRYERCAADPAYRAADENALMVVRPLFVTAFLLADFLHDQSFFGARQVLLSSASSKTAYATAWCLRQLKGIEIVGLTSNANLAFVRALGCYDRVLGYDGIEAMEPGVATVYADFSGSAEQRARLHRHFGDAMRHSAVIGATQFSAGSREAALPGAKPTFFFAPEQARSRIDSWGPAQFQQRLAESQRRFLDRALDASDPWLRIEEHQGLSSAIGLMQEMVKGHVDPRMGHALQIG
jgi:hypothetical protein